MVKTALFAVALASAACTGAGAHASSSDDARAAVQTVPHVDLQRYAGMWYEIANYPQFYQRKCARDTTAHYMPRSDSRIEVLNRCRTKDGGAEEADGEGTVVPDSGNAKLKVSFFWPFKGDYWIIGLDPDYRWTVVGTPDRKSLWVLSRTPQLTRDKLDLALAAARQQGFDLKPLEYTLQTER